MFGSRFLQVVKFDVDRRVLEPRAVCALDDRILDVSWISKDDQDCIVVLLAHNVVKLLSAATLDELAVVKGKTALLFSGSFYGTSWKDVRVAAGSAIDGIVIWSPASRGNPDVQLRGHDGAVFCVSWSQDGQTIASFGEDHTVRIWEDCQSQPKATMYGHASRVWRGACMLGSLVCSAGEDATCRIWDWSANSGRGRTLAVLEGHMKLDIWAVAVDQSGSLIATGGADSAILVWNVKKATALSNASVRNVSLSLPPWGSYGQAISERKRPDSIRSFALMNGGETLVATEAGYVLLFLPDASEWRTVFFDPSMAGNPKLIADETGLFVASHNGLIVFLSSSGPQRTFMEQFRFHTNLNGVTAGIKLLRRDGQLHVFAFTDRGRISWLKLASKELQLAGTLEPAEDRAAYPLSFEILGDLLLVATAGFKLLIYDMFFGPRPLDAILSLHGDHLVPHLVVVGRKLWTAGRDGFIRCWSLGEDCSTAELDDIRKGVNGRFSLVPLSEISINGRAERLSIPDPDNPEQMLVLAFLDNEFRLIKVSTGDVLLSVKTGNAQRQCEFLIELRNSESRFLRLASLVSGSVIGKETVQELERDRIEKLELQSPLHAMKINGMSFMGPQLLATAGEDGWVKVCSFAGSSLSTLHGLRSTEPFKSVVSVSPNLLFGAGGRCFLAAWSIVPLAKPQLLAIAPRTAEDARITDISALLQDDGSVLVLSGQSDGLLKLWRFAHSKFELLWESAIHSKCLLRCKIFRAKERIYGCSGATDGRLLFWCFSDKPIDSTSCDLQPAISLNVHQSGVNSLDCLVDDGKLVVASGGDDGDVAICLIDLDRMVVLEQAMAHAGFSAVRGLRLLSPSLFVSVNTEQRIKVWRWREDDRKFDIIADHPTSIADIGHLEVTDDEQTLAVVGQGLEIFNLKKIQCTTEQK